MFTQHSFLKTENPFMHFGCSFADTSILGCMLEKLWRDKGESAIFVLCFGVE